MSPKQNIDFKIEIQCPDCGTMLELNEKREYYCKDCKRVLYLLNSSCHFI